MPEHIKEDWLEAVKENFDSSLEENNIALCKEIIADTLDAGFQEAAQEMTLKLRQHTDSNANPND
jgi:hypothetical protein